MNTRFGEPESGFLVERRGDGDDSQVDAGVDKRIDIWEDRQASGNAVRIATRIGDGDEVDAFELAEHTGVVAAHHPYAKESCAQIGHQAAVPTTMRGVPAQSVASVAARPSTSSFTPGSCAGPRSR